jgi:hypothetical protein
LQDTRRRERARSAALDHALVEPRPRRVDQHDIRSKRPVGLGIERRLRVARLSQLGRGRAARACAQAWRARATGGEAGIVDLIARGIAARVGDRRLDRLDPDHFPGVAREREGDRARPAVDVQHTLAPRARRRLDRGRVQRLGLRAVGLQERMCGRLERQPAQPLLDRRRTGKHALARGVADRDVRALVVDVEHDAPDGRVERGDLLRPALDLRHLLARQLSLLGSYMGRFAELEAAAPPCEALVVGRPARRVGERAGLRHDPVRQFGRKPALGQVEALIELPTAVEAEPGRPVRRRLEGEFHLVAIAKDLG